MRLRERGHYLTFVTGVTNVNLARGATIDISTRGATRSIPSACPRGDAALRLIRALADRFKGHDQLRAAPPLGRAEPRDLENGRHIERA